MFANKKRFSYEILWLLTLRLLSVADDTFDDDDDDDDVDDDDDEDDEDDDDDPETVEIEARPIFVFDRDGGLICASTRR